MKSLFSIFCLLCWLGSTAQNNLPQPVKLPNGWSLSPAGRSFPLGDLPLNIAVSPTKKFLAVTNNGQSVQSIQLIDPKSETVLHAVVVPKSWYGLKFSADEKYLYAAGGNDNWILQFAIVNKQLLLKDTIKLGAKWPTKIGPTGMDIDDAQQRLYVVTKENNSLYIIDLKTKKVTQQISLGSEAYTCLLSPDKKTLYISLWGRDKVMAWDLATQRKQEWPVGIIPTRCASPKMAVIFMWQMLTTTPFRL